MIALENLYIGLNSTAEKLSIEISQMGTFSEIEVDTLNGSRSMEEIYVEWTNLLWKRIILRTQLKVLDALKLLFYSCNTRNLYGCAITSRSILEHVALLQYLADKVPWKDNREIPKDDMIRFTKQLYILAFGSRFRWDDILKKPVNLRQLISMGNWNRHKSERIPDIHILINSIDEELSKHDRTIEGQIKFLYTILCDVVHPSWGGDFAYDPKMYGKLSIQVDENQFKLGATLFCLPIVEITAQLIRICEDLKNYEISFLK